MIKNFVLGFTGENNKVFIELQLLFDLCQISMAFDIYHPGLWEKLTCKFLFGHFSQ